MDRAHGLKLNRLKLYGSEAEGKGRDVWGSSEIIYSSVSFK